jgi:O-antigen/teichoic acid export membrane protein
MKRPSLRELGQRTKARLRQIAGLVRLRAFETDTAQGRSQERHRRVALTSIASVAKKLITGVSLLISIRLTLSYLGNERYAVWVVISSTLSMLTWSDLGLGNGLINIIAECHGKEDRVAARQSVASALFMLSCVAVLILAAASVAFPHVNWASYFKISDIRAKAEYTHTFVVCLLCFALGLPLGVVSRIHSGLQEGYINDLYASVGSLVGLLGILIAIHLRLGLVWLALAMAGAPLLMSAVNAAHVFVFSHPWLLPRPTDIHAKMSAMLLRSGSLFLVLQLSLAIAFQSDNVVIARVMGVGVVPQYSLPSRLFQFVPLLFSFLLSSLWPAYREAVARGDLAWAERTFYRSLASSIGISLPIVGALFLLGPFLLHLWVGNAVHFSLALLIALSVQVLVNAAYNPISNFLNGMGVLGPQAIFTVAMAVVNITLSILLTRKIGISGVVWGSSISLLLCSIGPGMFYAKRAIRHSVLARELESSASQAAIAAS